MLEGLQSPGISVGKNSTHFRPNPSLWCRVVTILVKKLTTQKETAIKVSAS